MSQSVSDNPNDPVDPAAARSEAGAAVRCSVLTAELPLSAVCEPAVLHRHTRALGRVLFDRRVGGDTALVVTRAPVRLRVAGAACSIRALEAAAQPLLDALAVAVAGTRCSAEELLVEVPQAAAGDAAFDRDLLRAPSLFDPVRALLAALQDREPARVPIGLYGAFSFDLVDRFEELGPRRADVFDDADLELVLGLDAVRYDARRGVVEVTTRGLPWESLAAVQERHERVRRLLRTAEPAPVVALQCAEREVEQPDEGFLQGVRTLREHIAAGDVFQAVLARAVRWNSNADPLDVFDRLRAREQAPYAFHLELARGALFGASPETCVRVTDGVVEIRPIAGTTLRTGDVDTDERLALAMLFDPKERAEHVMLLDLARNDIARVAEPGSTEVVQQFAVEKYRRVQHLVSRVRGRLRPELDALHAYRSAANMGTLSGAPKARATELVRALEPTGRGFYGGAVGVLFQDGAFDSCIAIRSVRACDGVFRAMAGAGVVWHSDPERELEETERKLRAISEVMASAGEAGGARASEVSR